MEKLNMQTTNIVDENIKKIGELFPNCLTERLNDEGKPEIAIDFDQLRQELSKDIVEGQEERYQFTWPDKRNAIRLTNAPTTDTLRPCREESVDFDNTQNLYIEGDNLEVLKLLRENYLGKVKMIYIDPPYNTGNDILYQNDYSISQENYDSFCYDENGNRLFLNTEGNGRFHSDWCNMMYERIRIAKDLITNDGFFAIAIDHNELFNLGEICDEIFGYNNRIGVISVVHKPEGRNQAKYIGPSNEFMLLYIKDDTKAKIRNVAIDDEQVAAFDLHDKKGAYRLKNFIRTADGKYATREAKPDFWYPIWVSEDLKVISVNKFKDSLPIFPIIDNGVERTWKTTIQTCADRIKSGDIVAKNEKGKYVIYEKLRESQVIKTHWINKKYHGFHFGTKILDELLGVKTFDFPKSLYLMHDIFKLFTEGDDLILDFFSGSATSAHAIMQLNSEDKGKRKYILVQIPASCDKKSEAYKAGYKNICEIGKERIRRAGKKIKEESPLTTQDLDTGFRVLKLDSSNMQDVYYTPADFTDRDLFEENIKPDRTEEDLLFQAMIELGIELSAKIEKTEIAGKTVWNVSDGYLMACFDENVNETTITEIAKQQPYYFVMCDKSLANDNVADNFEQIFDHYSKDTIRRIL